MKLGGVRFGALSLKINVIRTKGSHQPLFEEINLVLLLKGVF